MGNKLEVECNHNSACGILSWENRIWIVWKIESSRLVSEREREREKDRERYLKYQRL